MCLIGHNLLVWKAWKLLRQRGLRYLVFRSAQFMRYILKEQSRRLEPQNLILSVKAALRSDTIIAWWCDTGDTRTNFGDALTPIMIKFLSGRDPVQSRRIFNIANKPVYTVCGSILDIVKKGDSLYGDPGLCVLTPIPVSLQRRYWRLEGRSVGKSC